MRNAGRLKSASAVVAVMLAGAAGAGVTWYVDAGAAPGGTGGSWGLAFSDLQSALAVAASGDTVVMAAGVYRPGTSTSASFSIPEGVQVLGGYAGAGAPGARDPSAYATVLSGDLNGDDGPAFANRTDNVRHVVTINSGNGVVLDGLVITGGHTTSVGAGVVIGAGSPTISGCVISSNDAFQGGAVYASAGLTATDTLFVDNAASAGGGAIYRIGSDPNFTVDGCEFRANSAGEGGAILFYNTAPGPLITNSVFDGNTSGGFSGAIGNLSAGMTLSWSIFTGNSAVVAGGALTANAGDAQITQCTIANNSAGTGGGIYLSSSASAPTLTLSILWDNSDSSGFTTGAQLTDPDGMAPTASVSQSDVMGSAVYPGSGNINADPLFQNPPSDYGLSPGSPCAPLGMGAVVSSNALPVAAATCLQLTDVGQTPRVKLDGLASSDTEDPFEALRFRWSVDGATVADGFGTPAAAVEVSMDYGPHTVELVVTDTDGASSTDSKVITVNAASLSLLEIGKTVIDFKAGGVGQGAYSIAGELGLPFGVNYTDLATTAGISVSVAGAQVGGATVTLAADQNTWLFSNPGAPGLTRVNIDWKGAKFEYKDTGLALRSNLITASQTALTVKYHIRKIGGPFAISIDGRASLSVDAQGVASADVPMDVDDSGKEVTLYLPFAITDDTMIAIAGPPYALIDAGDYLTASVGRYHIQGKFDSGAFPAGAATTPRTVDLSLTIGDEAYDGASGVGSADLAIKKDKWQAR